MHSLTTRTIRVGMAIAVAAAALLAFEAEPAGADTCARNCQHDGWQLPSGYRAIAALTTVWGGGPPPVPQPCTVDRGLGELYEPVDGHVEVNMYRGPDFYNVYIDCIEDGHTGLPTDANNFRFSLIQLYSVPIMEPEDLVEQALADMPVGSPDIQTSPGDGSSSLVNFDTWLMIDEATFTRGSRTDSEGPVSVTVWAEPDPDGDVLWDTGEGTKTCAGSGQDGSCTWPYQRSSAGQPSIDGAGRPAYAITASVTYTGGYSVSFFGSPVGGVDDLGDISRTSEPYFLAVDEAQALNTGG